MAKRTRTRKLPIAEINVVPYIDVMLVLLVIFMITAPLLTQGVNVDLPQANANPLDSEQREPLVVTVDAQGKYFIGIGDDKEQSITDDKLIQRAAAVLRRQPQTPVMVRGDQAVDYGRVVYAMTLLQRAGAPSIGLVTEMPQQTSP